MKEIKGVIFDLDGVIIDTARYHYLSWKGMANDLGFDFSLEQNEQLKGISRMDSLDLILSWGNYQADIDERNRLAKYKNDIYTKSISKLVQKDLLPGILEFLKELKENNMPACIGSASKNAKPILKATDISSYFVDIVDGTMVSKSKPDPEVFLIGAKAMNLEPRNIVVFEDSQSGLEAANKAGFLSIGVGKAEDLNNTDQHILGFDGFGIDNMKNLLQ